MIERSEIRFGTTIIPFQIRRSERRATVALAIDAGRLVVTAPRAVAVERLDAIVRGKALWVKQHLGRDHVAPAPPREFVTGETFRYLGRQYRIHVAENRTADEVKLDRGWLVVTAPDRRDCDRAALVREALIGWYRGRARDRLPAWVERWAVKLRLARTTVLIRNQRRRWGSCTPCGEIRLNWRLIQAPPSLVDYVVVHELVHLTRSDDGHSREFWHLLGRVIPDYDERRRRLRTLGAALQW